MAIIFREANSSRVAADFLAEAINRQLTTGKKVLWLVSGGSAAEVAVIARAQVQHAANLTVGLIDERYGEPMHADSNWRLLRDLDFDFDHTTAIPVLSGKSFDATIRDYAARIKKGFATNDFVIGLLGIGSDGHTAGILPDSPAATDGNLVCGYDGGKFMRITITPRAIAQLDEAIVFAMGQEKWPQLAKLADTIDIAKQPAQSLKQVPKVTIFTDMKEGTL